jgi:hypothetical protein
MTTCITVDAFVSDDVIVGDGAIPSEEVGIAVGTDDLLDPDPDGRCTVSAERAINGIADLRGYEFVNPPDPPFATEREAVSMVLLSPLDDAASNATAWACVTSPGLGTRYKTHDMAVFAPTYTTYAEASNAVRTTMERDAVIANVLGRNQRCVCEERGIPPDIFRRIWEEYRESNTHQGRFFHRDELVYRETKDSSQRMQSALV